MSDQTECERIQPVQTKMQGDTLTVDGDGPRSGEKSLEVETEEIKRKTRFTSTIWARRACCGSGESVVFTEKKDDPIAWTAHCDVMMSLVFWAKERGCGLVFSFCTD